MSGDINLPGFAKKEEEPQQNSNTNTEEESVEKEKVVEYSIKSCAVDIPSTGLKQNDPFTASGVVEKKADKISSPRLLACVKTVYNGQVDIIAKDVAAFIDEQNKFVFNFKYLYFNESFLRDNQKPEDAKFNLLLTVNGTTADREFTSDTIDLPMPVQENLPLEKGMFDDEACKSWPDKYVKDTEGYVPGTQVLDLQKLLAGRKYLKNDAPDGVFGPLTEDAVRSFQNDSLQKLRLNEETQKLIELKSVTYSGQANGIYDQAEKDELLQWRANKYQRPLVTLYHGDCDEESRKHGITPKSKDEYHEVGKPVLAAQNDLQKVGLYQNRKLDGWFGDLMRNAINELQEALKIGEFFSKDDDKKVVLPQEERLTKCVKGTACTETQAGIKNIIQKNLIVPNRSSKLTGSVGQGGDNKPDDVKLVKEKLKQLGYLINIIDEKSDLEFIKSIKNFQTCNKELPKNSGLILPPIPDGRIDKGGFTDKCLFSNNAPKYIEYKKNNVKPWSASEKEAKENADKDSEKFWNQVTTAWENISPYLPNDSVLTSGYRSAKEQRNMLRNWYNIKYAERIIKMFGKPIWEKNKKMQGVNDDVCEPEMCKQIKDAVNIDIAVPGRSKHQSGNALDVDGSLDAIVKSLLWTYINIKTTNITNIRKEKNGVIHVEFV